ncbi:cell division protein ZipA [Glaesserella sp.]|uniref:cell division protein ZipA n=1 Tax=Glaesserella sp. TaxID=2094731 RepID=UPI00359FDFF7
METYILFFILAGLLIAILVGFSIWSARREKSRIFSNTFSTRPPSTPINNDMIKTVPRSLNPQGLNPQSSLNPKQNAPDFTQTQQQEVQNSVKNIKISLPGQQMENTVTERPAAPQPETPATPLFAQQSPPSPVNEQPRTDIYDDPSRHKEPSQVEPHQDEIADTAPQHEEAPSTDTNIITLYVVAPEGEQFRGDVVIQQLETLGFQYGEYQIFHRHLDNAASPVLFSVANMMQPGVFDLTQIDKFSTVGLVFFMHLPSAGNDSVNLRLMIRTVESFAQAVGGFVLDDQHQIFDDAARQHYLLRVKS